MCSDTKVGRNDGDSTRAYDMPIPATTNATDLVGAAKNDSPERMTVVFTTYQSMQVVADAHKAGLPMFDLVVCDEAHRTTGALRADEGSSFLLVHDNNEVHARKRLYMTATPRIYAESAQLKAKEEDIYVASVGNQQKWHTLRPERSGVGLGSCKLPEGPVVLSSPFDSLSLHLLPAS